MTAPNGWPGKPGVPANPERDRWRELRQEALQAIQDADTNWGAADHAATFVLHTLAAALGVQSYTPCDGTETWEGDVAGTVYMILQAADVLDDDDRVARHAEVAALVAAGQEAVREACAKIVEAHAAAAKRCSEEGDVIYRIRAEFLANSYAIQSAADDVRVTPIPEDKP